MHYRQGTAVANADSPPTWRPEMALDPDFPYNIREYRRDVGRWIKATRVPPERQGPLLSLAIGGAARVVLDEMDDNDLALGRVVDLQDGKGDVLRSGPTLLFHVLDV